MKLFVVSIVSLLIGYGLYPVFNTQERRPSEDLLILFQRFLTEEGRRYAEAQSADEKLKLADEMYGKILLLLMSQLELKGTESRPVSIVRVPTRPADNNGILALPSEPIPKTPLSIRDKIFSDKLDTRTFLTFSNQPFLSPLDSRLVKLTGRFKGSLKLIVGSSRTGAPESLEMVITESLTKLQAQDNYDNETLSISEPTGSLFQVVPGDENLLMMRSQGRTFVFDLKFFPKLSGRILVQTKVHAEFELTKKP